MKTTTSTIITQKHDAEISAVKGIIITLMVIGHSGAPSWLTETIYLFHMPCFFFISGFLFKEKYLNNIQTYAIRKIKGIYIPFIKWSFIFLILHNVLFHLNIYANEYNINDFMQKSIQITTMTGSEQLLGGFWFLKELLYASIISVIIFKFITLLKKRLSIHLLIILSLLLMFTAVIYNQTSFKIPTIGSKTLLATSYFVLGVAFHKINTVLGDSNKLIAGTILFITFIISSFFVKGSIENTGFSILPFFAVSIIASISTIYLTKYLPGKIIKAFDYIGKNTLYILIFHFISFKIVSFIILTFNGETYTKLSSFPVLNNNNCYYWIFYTFVGIVVPLLLVYTTDVVKTNLKFTINAHK